MTLTVDSLVVSRMFSGFKSRCTCRRTTLVTKRNKTRAIPQFPCDIGIILLSDNNSSTELHTNCFSVCRYLTASQIWLKRRAAWSGTIQRSGFQNMVVLNQQSTGLYIMGAYKNSQFKNWICSLTVIVSTDDLMAQRVQDGCLSF